MRLEVPTPRPRRIAWFLSAHGFGHGVRATALLNALPAEVEVTFYTTLPESFFGEEALRPFRVVSCELDCGCVQPDSVSVDVPGTLARYAAIEARRDVLLPALADRLRDERVDLVIGDIPPLCFPLARLAQIPSVALCNFSWADIYGEYLDRHPAYRPLVDRMRADYAQAGRHLRASPFLGQPLTGQVEEIGVICRTGQSRRAELAARLGLDPDKKWCLIYLGSFGVEGVAWEQLEALADWEFLGLYPLTGATNYHHLVKDASLRYADLTASADLVLGKLGYNLIAECLTYETPIVFLGPSAFPEFPALRSFVLERNLGREISLEDLRAMRLRPHLDRAVKLEPRGMPAEGAARFMKAIFPTGA